MDSPLLFGAGWLEEASMRQPQISSASIDLPNRTLPVFVLLASVFIGPAAWEPVAQALRLRGQEAIVSPSPDKRAPKTAAEAIRQYADPIPADRQVVLVAHSNAGNFVPSLVSEFGVAAIVFVDSLIPVEAGLQTVVPVDRVLDLERLANADGYLPIWSNWFDEDDVDQLFMDPATRVEIESCMPTIPASYLRSSIAVEAGWDSIRAGFLAFGETYAAEKERARQKGWPVVELEGQHLHILQAPDEVAEVICRLAAA
jgi:hypothetical protein